RDLVEPVGDDVVEVLVAGDPGDGDEVDVTGDGVDLADAVDRGDLPGRLGDAGHFCLDEDDRRNHQATVAPGPTSGAPAVRTAGTLLRGTTEHGEQEDPGRDGIQHAEGHPPRGRQE